MIRHRPVLTLLACALALAPFPVRGGDHAHHGHSPADHAAEKAETAVPDTDAAVVARQLPSYPLTSCPVSDEELGSMGDPIDYVHDGRLVRFCCGMCEEKFLADPTKYLARIDAAVIEAQRDSYALGTCPISGMKLGSMGEPYDYVHGTRLVRFCCDGCVPKFEKNPETAMAKVDAALVEAQKAEYSAAMCPVMPEKAIDAMGEPYDVLYGTRLVRLCCEACVDEFWKAPEKYVARLDAGGE